VRWHKSGEVENECTLHNSIVLAIFVPKIIKVGGFLTKFWRKQFWLFFETQCIYKKLWNLVGRKQNYCNNNYMFTLLAGTYSMSRMNTVHRLFTSFIHVELNNTALNYDVIYSLLSMITCIARYALNSINRVCNVTAIYNVDLKSYTKYKTLYSYK